MSWKRSISRVVKEFGRSIRTVKVDVFVTSPSGFLSNRTILITGGGRGLGFHIAKKCVMEGATVVLTGRNQSTLEAAAESLGENAFGLTCDVSDLSSIEGVFQKAEEFCKSPIDSVVSNAVISLHEGDFRNVTEAGWDAQMDTNLKGSFFLCKEFVSYAEHRKLNRGNILVVTSERARRADDIPYGLTKVASDSFVRAMASKLIKQGIRVNAIAPGVTCSDMTGRSPDGNLNNDWQNNGRIFLPEEVAEVASFLLSDTSACISGEVIACNQGNHIACW